MLTIDELYDIASEAIEESLKFQGVLHAIDTGMCEDDIERLFPWVGPLARGIDDDQQQWQHSRIQAIRPKLSIRDQRDDTDSDERRISDEIDVEDVCSVCESSDGDASLTEDRYSTVLEFSDEDDIDDRQSCGTCSCLQSSY